jgi:DNA-binding transcriptional LysR family regulator
LDWGDLQYFLTITRHRTLSGAAAALGVQQSTMGRRLKALEARVGAKLLQRTPQGFVPTAAGDSILAHVERIDREALSVERAIAGKDGLLEGVVRLTAVEELTVEVLTPILAAFHARHPGIMLELLTDPRHLDLAKGEADIALRANRFTQNDLAARKVADFAFAAYASPAYLAAQGAPDFDAGAPGHRLLLPQDDVLASPQGAWFVGLTGGAQLALRSNSFSMLLAAAEAGMGIVCLPRFLGDAAPLQRLSAPSEAPLRELWLGVHMDIRDTPRFRSVIDFLADGLKQQTARLNPR